MLNSSDLEDNKKVLDFIEHATINADQIQNTVLSEILSRNADVEYLRRHHLDGRTDRHSFKKLVPVVSYEDIEPDITRIVYGDTSPILCCNPISEFLTSSGTSRGENKQIPLTEEEQERKNLFLSMSMVSRFIPGLEKGKGMYFLFTQSEVKMPGGLLARPALSSLYNSPHFKKVTLTNPYVNYTSPINTILCLDSYQSMYSQLLCGLCQNNTVLRIGAIFATTLIRVIHFLQEHWTLLCNDIQTGTLNSQITDPFVRESVMTILLKPNPNLANILESEFKKCSWQGIIRRLWPNTKYVDTIVTGTMSQYIPTLDYYSNGLPLISSLYASSECFFGINVNPLCNSNDVAYTLIPTMGYFEFLPVIKTNGEVVINDLEPHQELVDLVDVKLDQEYELVVTTFAGLYRYKMGDVLRVAGFKNKAPQFNFVNRKNVALSIDTEHTDEMELQQAIKRAVTLHLGSFDVNVADYTSYADADTTTTVPGHYVVYWELNVKKELTLPIPMCVYEDCCLTIEESLNSEYRWARTSNKTIGPLEIKIVEQGTFDKLMDYAISLGTSISQYKTPRCIKFAPMVELLNSRVVGCYFSPKCPEWVSGHKQCVKHD